MVVELEGHLHVEADELSQVTMSVRVLGTEHASDGEHFAETAEKNHILRIYSDIWSLNTRFTP